MSEQVQSFLDPRSVGGLEAWEGFEAQAAYALQRFPTWFEDSSCRGFQFERGEDVDVFHGTNTSAHGAVLHQVKATYLMPKEVGRLISGFRERYGGSPARSFVVATPRPHEDVRSAFEALARFKATQFTDAEEKERERTRKDAHSRLAKALALTTEDADFALEHVEFDHGWEEATPTLTGTIASSIGRLPECGKYTLMELHHAARELRLEVARARRHYWSREQLNALIHEAIATLHAGPPTAHGDVLAVCHQSLAPATAHPDPRKLWADFSERRLVRRTIDHGRLRRDNDWSSLPDEIAALLAPDGRFAEVLKLSATTPIVYYGFPHIPLAALAGFRLGDQPVARVVDYDRDRGAFAWSATQFEPLELTTVRNAERGLALVRVSVSNLVEHELCVPNSHEPVAIELHAELGARYRGVVLSEEQASAYVRKLREMLDVAVSGKPDIKEVHIFAAVPVSLAFRLGQIVSGTAYPPTWIYNFRLGDQPPYSWGLCLHRAGEPEALWTATQPPEGASRRDEKEEQPGGPLEGET